MGTKIHTFKSIKISLFGINKSSSGSSQLVDNNNSCRLEPSSFISPPFKFCFNSVLMQVIKISVDNYCITQCTKQFKNNSV